jgi:hypothetical protein
VYSSYCFLHSEWISFPKSLTFRDGVRLYLAEFLGLADERSVSKVDEARGKPRAFTL